MVASITILMITCPSLSPKKENNKPEFIYVPKRSFKNYDIEKFQDCLAKQNWALLDTINDINFAWRYVYEGVLLEANAICPFKRININKHRPEWFNTALTELGRERDILFRKYRNSKVKDGQSLSRALAKRREYNIRVKNTKRDFLKDQSSCVMATSRNSGNLLMTY